MLEDRDYMRQPADNDRSPLSHLLNLPNWSVTMWVVVLNVIAFIIECAVSTHPLNVIAHPLSFSPDNPDLNQYFALSLDGLRHGYLWQLFTYQFMHASVMHIFFNCWAIFMFGRAVEEALGAKNFLLVMLSSGVVGGLFQMLAALLWPDWFNGPVVGASAGAFGLVAAFATLFPERELFLLLFLIIPVKMRAKTLLLISGTLAFGGILFPGYLNVILGGNVANAAHLGGMLAGIFYVRKIVQGRWFHGHTFGEPPVRPAEPTITGTTTFWRPKAGKSEAEPTADELLRTQVDPILDKISAHGLQSLTQREREILEKASGKLAKR